MISLLSRTRPLTRFLGASNARFGVSFFSTEEVKQTEEVVEPEIEENSEDPNDTIEAQLAEFENEIKELNNTKMRLLAEMENVRRIAKKDVLNAKEYAISSFAKRLLDVADNLDRAIEAVPTDALENETPLMNTLYNGIKMTQTEMYKVFASEGIQKFGEIGDEFDPQRHDALLSMDCPEGETPNTIAQVAKTGFSMKKRILRPAQVCVFGA
eukprot:TRINITY_DN4358_c0_g1_i1.p2 TRINITY_DN4358_c0_g1~~TRINITY_DN4358_c0_g1_i1.p2  ORF type:complete len:212 (+),score=79.14 TRINITY_DN4358_c0_g1_i1:47-682(+)